METIEILTIIGANFGCLLAVMIPMFLWLRSEANSDRREAASDRRDILQLIRDIQQEMKDFHGRLCAIEEKNKTQK